MKWTLIIPVTGEVTAPIYLGSNNNQKLMEKLFNVIQSQPFYFES